MSEKVRRLLAGFDRRDAEPEPDEPHIFDLLDVLHDERAERHDSGWFPSGGEKALERLYRERRERGVPS